MDTKACNLKEGEIKQLIGLHGELLNDPTENHEVHIERINYLNRRLKEFGKDKNAEAAKPDPQTVADTKAGGW